MVVLAASICTHGGKALLSRLFRDLSKDRITALLANFPGLLSASGTQHTTVEDESVRYVYQPLEELYVVLLTNKQSNILQDIDTLHLFVGVVSNMVRVVDEKEVFDHAFEILSAFDEVVTLGYKEKLTMLQVQTFLEMDSHEEKIQEIIERNKELEATEERRRRAKEIQRKELARRNLEQQQAVFGQTLNETYGYTAAQTAPSYESQHAAPETPSYETPAPSRAIGGRGLQLGKKTTKVGDLQPLLSTRAPVFAQAPAPVPVHTQLTPSPAPLKKPANNGILITINEKISAQLSREGALVASEVKGDVQLRINDEELAHLRIVLAVGNAGANYKTHPNVDRALFTAENVLALKDKKKLFPSNDQSLGVLRWHATAKDTDSSLVPLILTAWVSPSDGNVDVTLEYEVTLQYVEAHPTQDTFEFQILVPVRDVELKDGEARYDVAEYGVVFTVEVPLSDPQGLFEFSTTAQEEDELFPMDVRFEITRTEGVTEADSYGLLRIVDVVSNDEDETLLPFDLHLTLVSENYVLE